MTIKQQILQLRKDFERINELTLHLDKALVQSRTKVNGTTYIIRLNKFPSIRFQGYEYVGASNKFYIYRQEINEDEKLLQNYEICLEDVYGNSIDFKEIQSMIKNKSLFYADVLVQNFTDILGCIDLTEDKQQYIIDDVKYTDQGHTEECWVYLSKKDIEQPSTTYEEEIELKENRHDET